MKEENMTNFSMSKEVNNAWMQYGSNRWIPDWNIFGHSSAERFFTFVAVNTRHCMVYLSFKTRAHNARMFRKIDARTRTHIQHTYNTHAMSCIIVLCMYVFVCFISPLFRCLS